MAATALDLSQIKSDFLSSASSFRTLIGLSSASSPSFAGLSLSTALPITSGGTGATTQAGAASALLPSQTSNAGKYLTTDGTTVSWATVSGGGSSSWGSITGTLSSQTDLQNALNAKASLSGAAFTGPITITTPLAVSSGGTGASTLTGYVKGNGTSLMTASSTIPGSDVSGNISGNAANVTGVVSLLNGGTGATTQPGAANAILPSQTSNAGKYLATDGTNVIWATVAGGGGGGAATWGSITGVLSTQTDLQSALDAKASLSGASFSGAVSMSTPLAIASGGTGAATNSAARTNLGATTVGSNLFTLTNPSAITFPRINADNTVSALDAASFRTAIGAGTSSTAGTVTSVSGTGTVSGLTLSGTVTSSGNLTLGGTLSVAASNFSSQTANTFLAAPNGTAGVPTFRSIVSADIPTLNQSTTGSAATLTTGRTISITGDVSYTSPAFDGSANVTAAGTLATVNTNVGSFTNASITVNGKGLITAASSGTAPVTSVGATSPVSSSGGTTPSISLASGYGDTQNPYASKTASYVLAAPSGTAGAPTFRALVSSDIPTLNQNTTGSAGSVANALTFNNSGTGSASGSTFNGASALTISHNSIGASPLAGSSSITTVGTITSGTWQGTAIGNTYLANSSLTIGTTAISLGGTSLTLGGLTSVAVTQDPTSALQLATKQYVDAVTQGLHIHASCAVATTGTLASITGGTVTYNNGSSGVGATLTLSVALTTLDGYTLQNGDRVLVKNEAAAANNGIYTWATGGTVLTRATDFDSSIEIDSGDFTFVSNGTLYAGTGWVQTNVVATVGTTAVSFTQFSGPGTYTAGTGLTLTGSQFSLTSPVAIANGGTGATTAANALTSLGAYPATNPNGYTSNTGTVTSVGLSVPTGLSVANSPVTGSGTLTVTYASGYAIPTTASQTNWDTAYTDRLKWDGGATGLTASTGRTSLGATTVGSNFFTLTDPAAITFPRINADNTVSALTASAFRTAIGAGTGDGTVTSVSGTAPVSSSGGTTPAISLASGYGDTQNPYASKTANYVLAAPNGTAGVPTFRALVAADVPTLNQNTTGTASNVTGIVALANGGTGASTQAGAANAVLPSQATNSGKYLTTNGTDVSWGTPTASAAWGSITGTLSDQTDLQSALNAKLSLTGGTMTGTITSTFGSITTSKPFFSATQFWNGTGTDIFYGQIFDITTTGGAASASSRVFDYRVDGSSIFNLTSNGIFYRGTDYFVNSVGLCWNNTATLGTAGLVLDDASYIAFAQTGQDVFGLKDLYLYRDAANTLAQRNATSAQSFRLYNTYTSGTSYERGQLSWVGNVLLIGTEKGSGGGTARALEFQTDATTRLVISTTGLLQLAGTTASFPAIKRNATAINFRLADDSADAPITAGQTTLSASLDLTMRTVTYGATMAIDAALGNKIEITLAGGGTISNPTNAVNGRVLIFRLRQDGTGSKVPVWDTQYQFSGDLASVTLSTAANAVDRIAFEYDSTLTKWVCISFIRGT